MNKKLLLLTVLLAACCRDVRWGTVTKVDKDHKFILSSKWHFVVRLDDGSIVTGTSTSIVKVGWRVAVDCHDYIVGVREQ